MSRPRVVIDCDPGIDDALAIVAAVHLTDLVGITTVSGNVDIEHTTRNALALVEATGHDIPVHRGAARPLVAPPHDAARVHGASGLGPVELGDPSRPAESDDAVGFLLDTAANDIHLLAIGPLTNVAAALRADPTFASRLGGVTVMGGALPNGPALPDGPALPEGNVTPTAEFNVWADPEAAAIVLGAGAPITMVGLDLTHQVMLAPAHADRLDAAATHLTTIAAQLVRFGIERMQEMRGWDGVPMHDATALVAVTDPTLFSGAEGSVAVAPTHHERRGTTTVADTDGPVRVLRRVDAAAVGTRVVDAIIEAGSA